MKVRKDTRRHIAVRRELDERVQARLAQAQALMQRTRLLIVKLDRQLAAARGAADPLKATS